MPPLPGFDANNLLHTHSEVTAALHAILEPLRPHFSPSFARISLPANTGTHFDRSAAELEGFARPVWGVGALLASASAQAAAQSSASPSNADTAKTTIDVEGRLNPCPVEVESKVLSELVSPWREGLVAGTDPSHAEFWGAIQNTDQRMVEAEIIAFALLSAPDTFYHSYSQSIQTNIRTWLLGMNGKTMPESNWRWFRIMSNLALIQVCSVDEKEVRPQMESDFECLEGMVLDEGWSADGPWLSSEGQEKEEEDVWSSGRVDKVGRGRQADYYSGSFAIQFSQLIYCRFALDWDPKRCEVYEQRARDFGAGFWRYFDENGAAIPFGRSLTYRFACGAFFSALAFADVPNMPAPLDSPGAIKGFLLRHLRWWARNSSDAFDSDGTMNIGYLYPNMYMSEDYNSPQSPYWALKTLLALSLPPKSTFWTSEELPYPSNISTPTLLKAPTQILVNNPNHHYLLSAGQFCAWPLKATQAKYSKFAYSSTFGFSVPTGTLLPQLAPDNTLIFSRDGAGSWSQKWKSKIPTFLNAKAGDGKEIVPAMQVEWQPFTDKTVTVTTTLLPPCTKWPDWHVRIHRVKILPGALIKPAKVLLAVEGGFAISGRNVDGSALPNIPSVSVGQSETTFYGTHSTSSSALILSPAGASGIVHLSTRIPYPEGFDEEYEISVGDGYHVQVESTGTILKPDANTNLMTQRTLIPMIERTVYCYSERATEVVLAVGVFAVAESERSVWERWSDRPVLRVDEGDEGVEYGYA